MSLDADGTVDQGTQGEQIVDAGDNSQTTQQDQGGQQVGSPQNDQAGGVGGQQPSQQKSAQASNQGQQPAPAPAPVATQPPEDWRASITDPALKNIADRITSPVDAIKVIQDLRTQNSQRIKIPDEKATEEDVAKFRKAIGVPDQATGYEINLPDGMQMTEADQAVLSAVVPLAFESGVPAEAFNKFVGKYMELNKQAEQNVIAQLQQYGQDSERLLRKEWGSDFDRHVNLANRVGEVVGGPEFKAFLNETPIPGGGMLGDHPAMVRFLATVGRRTDEGDLLLTATPEERNNVQAEIDRLNNEVPPGSPNYTNPAHQSKLQDLYQRLHGNTPIVGSQQRQL